MTAAGACRSATLRRWIGKSGPVDRTAQSPRAALRCGLGDTYKACSSSESANCSPAFTHHGRCRCRYQRLWAAVLWSEGGVISHRSAARLWQLPVPSTTTVHVTVRIGDIASRSQASACIGCRSGAWTAFHMTGWPPPTGADDRRPVTHGTVRAASDLRDRALQQGWLIDDPRQARDASRAVPATSKCVGCSPRSNPAHKPSPSASCTDASGARTCRWVAQYPIKWPRPDRVRRRRIPGPEGRD